MLGVKWAIFLVTVIYLYQVVFKSRDFSNFLENIASLTTGNYGYLILTIVLMSVNWGFEALKWQFLLKHIQILSFWKAYKAVFSGVTVSSIMPNRLAEYLGRIFYIQPHKRIKAIVATLVGSFAQTFATVLTGSVAFLVFYSELNGESRYIFYVLIFLVVSLNGLLLLLYFNVSLLNRLIPPKSYLLKVKQYINVLSYFHSKGLSRILLWSILRYGVFFTQFYLLLKTFNVEIKLLEVAVAVPVVFLVQALIPSIALAELGIRGATAVHFIGFFAEENLGILTSTYSLWFINLLIPASIGAIFLIALRNRENENEN